MSYEYMSIDNPIHPYRLKKMDVFFSDLSCLDIVKTVLDEEGKIRNFSGIGERRALEERASYRPVL